VRVPRINVPILFGVGSEDRVIPPQEARKLFKVAHCPKQWLSITGAGHNDIFDYEELWKELHRFIYTVLIEKPSND
jgi:pimeloyl-ACP methyl ester carboxylesterase